MKLMLDKLKILADSAKYDVSCSTSGVGRKNGGKIGNASASGICHSWSADGRCISLLKVLFTNKCAYNCEYCINKRSADVQRASFEPDELAQLTIEFYRRNYIEGLFLSSAVEVSPDYTGERILRCLQMLRREFGFAGYIHAKIIPGMADTLVHAIGLEADRLSVNVEMPSSESLKLLAPQKKAKEIFQPMRQITNTLIERKGLKGPGTMFKGENLNTNLNYLNPTEENISLAPAQIRSSRNSTFAPAGQTTQMIIGASKESDRHILTTTEKLYHTFKMKRVYYSAYIPVVNSPILPNALTAPPLAREHRLYQADWLLRFYGFSANELLDEANPNLDPDLDPKMSWAIRNLNLFPMEVNKVSMDQLIRIPGVGSVSALRIIRQRKVKAVKYEDLKKMGVALNRARHFLTCNSRYYGEKNFEPYVIKNSILQLNDGVQMSMFGSFSPRILDGRESEGKVKLNG
ncbi:MAG: putative DNA modification/repair radical SAM protein [Anaerovoracaceae bacterium]